MREAKGARPGANETELTRRLEAREGVQGKGIGSGFIAELMLQEAGCRTGKSQNGIIFMILLVELEMRRQAPIPFRDRLKTGNEGGHINKGDTLLGS